MATMDSKYIQHLRKISAVLLRLISRTLKLFPFGLVIVPVILFYFAPDSFLAEIIHEDRKSTRLNSSHITISDEFMPVNSRK